MANYMTDTDMDIDAMYAFADMNADGLAEETQAEEVCEVLERGFGANGEMQGIGEYERHDSEVERSVGTEYSVLEALAAAFGLEALTGQTQADAASVLEAVANGFGAMLATLVAMANGRCEGDSEPVTLPEATVADQNRHRQWDMDRELLGDEILASLGMASDPNAELRAAQAAIQKGAKEAKERRLADLLAWADAMERVIVHTRASQWGAVSKLWCSTVLAKGKEVSHAYKSGQEAARATEPPDWSKQYLNSELNGRFIERSKALWETYRERKAAVTLQTKQERELKMAQQLERLRDNGPKVAFVQSHFRTVPGRK